jgi:hypothetical protein
MPRVKTGDTLDQAAIPMNRSMNWTLPTTGKPSDLPLSYLVHRLEASNRLHGAAIPLPTHTS